jgi:hypothetical protein
MIQWILFVMLMLQPNAPWKDTYAETAKAIAEVSHTNPLFEGEKGEQKTAALFVSLAWYESRFNPKAIGDHGKSFGLYQQQGHGEISDSRVATEVAYNQIKTSFRVCNGKPIEDRLGWYAAGGPTCDYGLRESRHRMLKAFWLVGKFPFKGD